MIPGVDVLTNSSEQCFTTCPRKFYWSYQLCWRPGKIKKPLRIGTGLHEGLDVLAKGQGIDNAVEAVGDVYEGYKTDAANWPDPQGAIYDLSIECVTTQCLVAGYDDAWRNSAIVILQSEGQFDLPIINPESGRSSRTFRQAGKRDRIGQIPDIGLALIETKTSSENIEPGSDYRHVLAIDSQISKYVLAARAEGIDVETCLYDVTRKPTIKPTLVPDLDEYKLKIVRNPDGSRAYTKQHKPRQTADKAAGQYLVTTPMTPNQWRHKLSTDIESRPAYYYQRFEIARLDSDLAEYQQELWWISEDIRRCRNTGRWARRTQSCRKYNSLCPYYPLCAGMVDITAGVPAGFRQAETAHEELKTPDESET